MDLLHSYRITLENLAFLGGGFVLGVLVCTVLAKSFSLFFSRSLKALSNQALYDHGVRFMTLADTYFKGYVKEARKDFDAKGDEIRATLDPVHRTLEQYEARLREMEAQRERASGAISERLAEMGRVQQKLHLETGNLVKALRLPHVRGRWGEITLRRAVELAGMAGHCDFLEQPTARGGALRPDMVVTLPGKRQIVVDAKVPLMAYLDALEADTEKEYNARMSDHARQVGAHIRSLCAKPYTEAFSPTPEFVVLFIPGENFFSAALGSQPDLMEKSAEKGVILATPTTLIALLKTVAYAWDQKKSHENAEEIRKAGKQLYTQVSAMVAHMNRLGRDIEKCAATFNRTARAMENKVMPSAQKLEASGVGKGKLAGIQGVETPGTRMKPPGAD